jgi:hypothetical protein
VDLNLSFHTKEVVMIIEGLVLSILATVFAAKKGGKTAAALHIAGNHYLRKEGYAKGEGPLSEKACDGLGIFIHEESPSEAGQCLAYAAPLVPGLKRFANTHFSLTISEGRFLDELVKPLKALMRARDRVGQEWIKAVLSASSDSAAELAEEKKKLDLDLEDAAKPIAAFLDNVSPSRRRHVAPGA